jgi:hypothetical protein
VFKFRGHLGLYTFRFLNPLYCISCHIGDSVSFKFGGMDKHSVCLSHILCLFVLLVVLIAFVCIYLILSVYNFFSFLFVAMLLIGHNLHYN